MTRYFSAVAALAIVAVTTLWQPPAAAAPVRVTMTEVAPNPEAPVAPSVTVTTALPSAEAAVPATFSCVGLDGKKFEWRFVNAPFAATCERRE